MREAVGCWLLAISQQLLSPPPKRFNEVLDVGAKEIIYRLQGIGIGGGRKVECSAKKMFHRISSKKLVGGSGISFEVKINTTCSSGRTEFHRLYGDRATGKVSV